MLSAPIRQISILTDFGLQDIYVGVMKGVIDKIAPNCKVVDLCHHIPPGETKVAALMLSAALPYFSPKTLHLCVIDPGVGSSRRIIYVSSPLGHFLAPDNGVLSPIFESGQPFRCWSVTNTEFMLPNTSNTFHGRDIFAPIAAHLAQGIPAAKMGQEIIDPLQDRIAHPQLKGAMIEGEVIYIDGFGNVCTNIPARFSHALKSASVPQSNMTFHGPCSTSYSHMNPGEALIIVNSFDYIELAINRGDAAAKYKVQRGHKVVVTLDDQETIDNS